MRTEDEIMSTSPEDQPFSNHDEYDRWADRYCYECVKDDIDTDLFCPLITAALLDKWPAEWTRRKVKWEHGGKSGSYEVVDTCTEFEQRRDDGPDEDEPKPPPPPAPECDGQADLFTAIVDAAVEDMEAAGQRQAVTV